MPKEITKDRVKINQRNATKSTGPLNTTSTRFNALKHGMLAVGITELDDCGYQELVRHMKSSFQPEGPLENFLCERMAFCMVRIKRALRLEAEFITSELHPPITKVEGGHLNGDSEFLYGTTIVLDPGLPARLPSSAVDTLVGKFQRYETSIENKLYRSMHELERLQRQRKGDFLSPPSVGDLGFSVE